MQISYKKKEKIYEQILALLFSKSPKALFTNQIASEIARDEEFIKNLLLELKKKNLVMQINKNPNGIDYKRRSRWKLTEIVYKAYKQHQEIN